MPTIKVRPKITDATREPVADRPVRPAILNHLEQSLAENEAVGRLLAELSTLEPLDTSTSDVDEDLLPLG